MRHAASKAIRRGDEKTMYSRSFSHYRKRDGLFCLFIELFRGARSVFLIQIILPVFLSLIFISLMVTTPIFASSDVRPVIAVKLDGTITPASDDIVKAALDKTKNGDIQALMLLLDTPGGGLAETIAILSLVEETKMPIIAYVYPEGAKAWSAGTLILQGSDVAAMAPHTIIGSAQPVQLSPTGETEPINDSKTTNAIVALIQEKARQHGRNTTAAKEFVVSNLNLNADEAKKYDVIEYIASSSEDLMVQINDSKVKNITLITTGSEVQYFDPPLNLRLLAILSDPPLAGLLMLVGLYALVFGLSSPGFGSEAFGVAALALGLIGLGFNVSLGAVFLILLGVGLILADLHSHSFGILAVSGLICIVVGSILFVPTGFPQWYVPGGYQQSMALALILPSIVLGVFLAFAIYKVSKIRFAPIFSGRFAGEVAEAIDSLDPKGYVLFQGEYWQAEAEETIDKGEKVVIVEKDGARLRVKRK